MNRGRGFYSFLKWVVKLVFPKFEIVGKENIPDGACIIVGNHSHTYGPIASELYTPGTHYTWCIGEMMHREEVADYAYKDFWSGKPLYVRWFFRLSSYVITPLAVCVFNNANTIGVYHDARIIDTFKETLKKLNMGSRIVIFPEHYEKHNNIIYDFQYNFIDIGRFYYKKEKKELYFVPMYLCPELRKMCFGKPVGYNADNMPEAERRRICDTLMNEITDMAVSLPEHTVVPYPNIPKRAYLKNIPYRSFMNENEKTAL